MNKPFLSVTIAGFWITFSEFLRNEILFKSYWIDHYRLLGLKFETTPVNGILWMVWSFLLAYLIYKLLQKYSLRETIILSWIPAFLMMWITIYNLQVLPVSLLLIAVPLSVLEIYVSVLILVKFWKGNI